jgi:hypothetical protein
VKRVEIQDTVDGKFDEVVWVHINRETDASGRKSGAEARGHEKGEDEVNLPESLSQSLHSYPV